jgi:integrase
MCVRKREDGRWQYDIVIHRNGRRIRARGACKGARNRAEALAIERARRAELEAEPEAPPPPPMTFAAHAEEVMTLHATVENKHSERKSKRSILDRHLLPAFGHLALDAIGPRQIAAYKAEKLKPSDGTVGLKPKTINNHLTVLRKSLVLAKEWGRLAVVPTVGFLRVKKPEIDFFTFDEAARILAGAERDPWYVMILCGLRAGLRQGELLELRWDDVDLIKGALRIRRAIYDGVIDVPKGGRNREVPMGDDLRAALRELPSRFAGGLVWPCEGGRNLTKGEAKWPLWRACKRAGLRRVGWHVLRHTFASHLVMRGVPLKAVQELLGHASIEMTMRYAHLAPDVSREAVKLLDAPVPVRKASGAE